MRKSYFLSVTLFFAALFVLLTLSTNILAFLDLPSFIVTVIFPIAIIPGVFTKGEVLTAFKAPFCQAELTELKLARSFWFFLGKILNCTAFLGFITGFIIILSNVSDISQIGPGLALSLLCVLYVAILQIVLILPFKGAIEKRMAKEE